MKVFAVIPVKKFENAKTRLSPILSQRDRVNLSALMLEETLRVLSAANRFQKIIVVSSDERARIISKPFGADFIHEDKDTGVTRAVELGDAYSMSHQADATVIVPQDLPLLNVEEITKACDLAEAETKCVVICPSKRYDGTNLLIRKPPNVISTSYDLNSYENHVTSARQADAHVEEFLSEKLMLDLDTPADVAVLEAGPKNRVGEFLRLRRNNDS